MTRSRAIEFAVRGALGLASLALPGCKGYRIEYITRPGYYQEAMPPGSPQRVTLDDGTVLVFQTRDAQKDLEPKTAGPGDKPEPFRIREEKDDGTVILRALLPQHVLANTLTCLRKQE